MTKRTLWTITVDYRDEGPATHVYDTPTAAQEMLAAIMYTESFVSLRSLRVEQTVAGDVELAHVPVTRLPPPKDAVLRAVVEA